MAFLLTGYVLSTCMTQDYNMTHEEQEVRTVYTSQTNSCFLPTTVGLQELYESIKLVNEQKYYRAMYTRSVKIIIGRSDPQL